MRLRQVQTCARCRESKRQCDKARPSCARCQHAGVACRYDTMQNTDGPVSSEDVGLATPPDTEVSSNPCTDYCGPLNGVLAPPKSIKKRNRACLSCTRCHRLKVKCDKKQPCCGRCGRSGFERTCIYTHRARQTFQPASSPAQCFKNEEDPEFVVATWFLRKRGSSHFRAILSRIQSLPGIGHSLFAMAVKEHSKGDCSNDLALPGNFPFGTPESAQYTSLDKIHALLRDHRTEAPNYTARYIRVYHASMPVFHLERFQTEIDRFWESPSASDISWLAQYLAILGLGAFAQSGDEKLSAQFFFASEACLAKTPYMFRPTIINVRTLVLLVLAKQISYATCWALDACWNITGLVVRLALMMGLHQDFLPDCDIPSIVAERELRQRLWNAVAYLDIQLSIITGQSSPLPKDALLISSMSNGCGFLQDQWDAILPPSFPVICHFLPRINSNNDSLTYDEVLQYDVEVRQFMRQAAAVHGGEISRMSVDIFFRRVLLVLHLRYALEPEAPTLYHTSYWTSLECSLALIVHHRELSEELHLPEEKVYLIARRFMLDFFMAALTTSLHLLRTDAPLAATSTSEGTIPPRQTIQDTLKSCLDLFAKEQTRSVCFRSGYRLLTAVYRLIPKE